jgi:cysteine-rich repeat protein
VNRSLPKPFILAASLVAVAALPARAQVDSADDVCAPGADPCFINSTIEPADNSILDFGDREVRVQGSGRIDLGNRRTTILCGDFTVEAGDVVALKIRGPNGFGQTDGGTLTVRAERGCSIDQNTRCTNDLDCSFGACSLNVCEGDALRTCTADASCQLGQCNTFVCERGKSRQCTQASDCSFGPCNFAERKCAGDPAVRCFSDLDCNLGTCQTGDPRCESDTTVSCNTAQDCDLGNCSVDVCAQIEGDAYRECSTNSDCFDGACTVGTGNVVLNSRTRADGASPGNLDFRAAGDLTVNNFINANGNTADSDGGIIDLEAGTGTLTVNAQLQVSGGGASQGGEVAMSSGGDIVINDLIDATGGDFDGGLVEFLADGDVVIAADIDADSNSGEGFGGEISVLADGDITISGDIKLKTKGHQSAFNSAGDGGLQEYSALGTVTFGSAAKIEASGAGPDGSCDEVIFESDDEDVVIEGQIVCSTNGAQGAGGTFEVNSGRDILIAGTASVDVTGAEFGAGTVDIFADRNATVGGFIDASASNNGTVDTITVDAGKDIFINGELKISGTAANTANGLIDVDGCFITIENGGFLNNQGSFGENSFTVSELLTIESGAEVSADAVTGENLVRLRDEDNQPVVNGLVSPALTVSIVDTIGECSECGNSRLEGSETCDDGNIDNGDGCSDDCQLETCIAQTPGYPNVPICDDGNGCTVDLCNPTTGNCEHTLSCDDGVECTVDTCNGDVCENMPDNGACDDGNVCTNDICGTMGCSFSGNTSPCDDGVACTVSDICNGSGVCQGTDNCPAGQQCSLGSGQCVPDGGICGDGFVDGGEDCDDGDTAWAPGEYCSAGCAQLACGDPNDDDRSTASDSLFALNTAVGVSSCDLCLCDVDDNGGVTASDALRLLNFAVSVPGIVLSCPACP